MKIRIAVLLSPLFAPLAVPAQTTTHARPHSAARMLAADHGCAKLPELSPKIPALPPETPCAKPLYTITTVPQANISDVSPALADSIRQYLGIEPLTFSLSYTDIKVGTGELAEPHKWYSVRYTGYLHDGTIFDSTENHPGAAPFVIQQGVHGVIPGWDTGFYGMRVGGKRRLFIPHELAYGPRANGPIPANSDLIFDIELVSESDTDPTPAPAPAPKPASSAPAPTSAAPTPAPKPQ